MKDDDRMEQKLRDSTPGATAVGIDVGLILIIIVSFIEALIIVHTWRWLS